MLAFALGTLPLLWLAQSRYGWLRQKLSPRTLTRMQTVLALIAAGVMLWRMRSAFGFNGPSLENFIC